MRQLMETATKWLVEAPLWQAVLALLVENLFVFAFALVFAFASVAGAVSWAGAGAGAVARKPIMKRQPRKQRFSIMPTCYPQKRPLVNADGKTNKPTGKRRAPCCS